MHRDEDLHPLTDAVSLGVVVPAHQAAREIGACLEGLFAAGFPPAEILVVDDGSRDGTGDLARAAGVRVVVNDAPLRPARARNRGVAETDAEIIVFVDADVVVHPGARDRILAHFRKPSALCAVFGSYDDAPPAPRLVSRYRNLLHHFVHQTSRRQAATFWTGFGAVRRDAFLRLGGLDSAWENIEDVEFGLRLTRSGRRIRLDPDLRATHLKDWTFRGMVLTDLRGRAVPWTRLLMFQGAAAGDLNTSVSHKVSAASVALFFAAVVLSLFEAEILWAVFVAVLVFCWANRAFFGFLTRRHGFWFMLRVVPFHAAHYTAALLGYAWVLLAEALPARLRSHLSSRMG